MGKLRIAAGLGCLGAAAVISVPPLRRRFLTGPLLGKLRERRMLPRISRTEMEALSAGDVWVEGEFFTGRPDLERIAREPYPELSAEEQAFLDGPTQRLCETVDDWKAWARRDLPPEAWALIRRERFWGMIIPRRYGGLGFSALAHSAVIMKLASRSIALSITVMVPNSLGPAELLIRYGTDAQKEYYLPRLARGDEVPCFALTEPEAGSDAASIRSSGVVFRGDDGSLYLRLDWNKRWITLAAIATILGVAFRLRDPGNLLGKGEDLGITCALVPTGTPGVQIHRRHDPLSVPFYNSPTQGRDVVVPIGAIIGGPERAGQGWVMLMESLAAGRGISLPAQSTAGAKYVARVASARAAVRQQFSLPIGRFEGVQALLARIGGFTYLLEAARRYTCGAIDSGSRPAIVSAIEKYHSTELNRRLINDAMDIAGGAGITLGPRNLLAHEYFAAPIAITVEGANILTRSLIIFGQGVLRAHPYLLRELTAAGAGDVAGFERALGGHLAAFALNVGRLSVLSLTRGRIARAPVRGPAAGYWKKLAWASSAFAFAADLELLSAGGRFKRMEALSGRLADIVSWMYLISAVLRRFDAEGSRAEDEPFMRWCAETGFAEIQTAFEGLYENGGPLSRAARFLVSLNPIGTAPRDALGFRIARALQTPGELRDARLTGGIFVPSDPRDPFYRLEEALRLADRAKSGDPSAVREARAARSAVIQVDDFSFEDYLSGGRRAA